MGDPPKGGGSRRSMMQAVLAVTQKELSLATIGPSVLQREERPGYYFLWVPPRWVAAILYAPTETHTAESCALALCREAVSEGVKMRCPPVVAERIVWVETDTARVDLTSAF